MERLVICALLGVFASCTCGSEPPPRAAEPAPNGPSAEIAGRRWTLSRQGRAVILAVYDGAREIARLKEPSSGKDPTLEIEPIDLGPGLQTARVRFGVRYTLVEFHRDAGLRILMSRVDGERSPLRILETMSNGRFDVEDLSRPDEPEVHRWIRLEDGFGYSSESPRNAAIFGAVASSWDLDDAALGGGPRSAIDGIPETAWVAASKETAVPTLRVDLRVHRRVRSIEVLPNCGDGTRPRIKKLRVSARYQRQTYELPDDPTQTWRKLAWPHESSTDELTFEILDIYGDYLIGPCISEIALNLAPLSTPEGDVEYFYVALGADCETNWSELIARHHYDKDADEIDEDPRTYSKHKSKDGVSSASVQCVNTEYQPGCSQRLSWILDRFGTSDPPQFFYKEYVMLRYRFEDAVIEVAFEPESDYPAWITLLCDEPAATGGSK